MREYPDTSVADLDVAAVVEILRTAPVRRGILFGSFARGEERDASDVDVAVEFDASLSSTERTSARLSLIERLGTALGRDDVDAVPIGDAPAELRREINEDGIVLVGPEDPLPVDDAGETSHEERMARFDELLGDLERVV